MRVGRLVIGTVMVHAVHEPLDWASSFAGQSGAGAMWLILCTLCKLPSVEARQHDITERAQAGCGREVMRAQRHSLLAQSRSEWASGTVLGSVLLALCRYARIVGKLVYPLVHRVPTRGRACAIYVK